MKRVKILSVFVMLISTQSYAFPEALDKAIYYSFDVPIHLEKRINDECYGIEDDDQSMMLITDCGGYLNVISATLTLGLIKSSKKTKSRYINAAQIYLDDKVLECTIINVKDLGGRIFELEYECR